jgi:hypothetical protein
MKMAGWIMTALFALFMLGASVAPKFLGAQAAADSLTSIGWSAQHLPLIGTIELVATLLFVWPRTALLGAALLMALFGGALASHWRAGSPLFSHTLFSVYLGVFMWIALWLRDASIRKLFPMDSGAA